MLKWMMMMIIIIIVIVIIVLNCCCCCCSGTESEYVGYIWGGRAVTAELDADGFRSGAAADGGHEPVERGSGSFLRGEQLVVGESAIGQSAGQLQSREPVETDATDGGGSRQAATPLPDVATTEEQQQCPSRVVIHPIARSVAFTGGRRQSLAFPDGPARPAAASRIAHDRRGETEDVERGLGRRSVHPPIAQSGQHQSTAPGPVEQLSAGAVGYGGGGGGGSSGSGGLGRSLGLAEEGTAQPAPVHQFPG